MTATTATVEVGFLLRRRLRQLLDEHPARPEWVEIKRGLTSSFVVAAHGPGELAALRRLLLSFSPYVDC